MQIDLAQTCSSIARWWFLLVAGLVVGGVAGFVAARGMTPVYQSGVTVQIARGPDAGNDDQSRAQTSIRTTAELARTLPILREAATRVGIAVPPLQLQSAATATPIRETHLLRITVEDTDRERVAMFAAALASVLSAHLDQTQAAQFSASKAGINQAIDSLRSGIANRDLKVAQLRAEPATPNRDAALALAESELQEARNSYAGALKAQADLLLLEARSVERLTVVEPPQVPDGPVRPSRSRTIMLGMFGGLTVALAVILGVGVFENARSRARRFEGQTGLPVLLEVPPVDRDGARVRDGWIADCYGSLPARIAAQGVAARSILITSPRAVEGTSSVAASVAVALAQSGRRVVLVDGDLRRPTLARLFDLPDGPGLSTLLFTAKSAVALLRSTTIPGLRILAAGPLPPDAAAFLRDHSARERLAELYVVSDVVVVVAPPISAGPDALLIGLDTDATVLVVDAQQAIDESTTGAVSALAASGIRVVGSVIQGAGRLDHEHVAAGARQMSGEHPLVPAGSS